jgi:hypothetical protein
MKFVLTAMSASVLTSAHSNTNFIKNLLGRSELVWAKGWIVWVWFTNMTNYFSSHGSEAHLATYLMGTSGDFGGGGGWPGH